MDEQDRGRFLTNLEGATHELFGGDPEEIVLRIARVGEGAETLSDLARDLRAEASRYERMADDGWRLTAPFADGQARCRKDGAEQGEAAPASSSASPPVRLSAVVEGAPSLPEAARRLRVAADGYERLMQEGRHLGQPVHDGRVPLA